VTAPALRHVSQHALGQTPMPTQPRTPQHSPKPARTTRMQEGQRPPEMPCASRDAPEPDLQSIKNNTTPPRPRTGQRSYRPCHLPPRSAGAVMADPISYRPLNPPCHSRGEPT